MADDPTHPYRTPWEPARLALAPARSATPWELRRELRSLRSHIDRLRAGTVDPPEPGDLLDAITRLTEARDWIRGWARPTRSALVVLALALVGPVALTTARQPGGVMLALLAIVLGCVAGAFAEFWANRWLDLVAEYDGAIADLRDYSKTKPVSVTEARARLAILLESLSREESARLSAEIARVRVDLLAAGEDTEAEGQPDRSDDPKKRER